MSEREWIMVSCGQALHAGEAYYAADDEGRVTRHVAEAFYPACAEDGRPAMVRSGAHLHRADRCWLDGLECAAAEEMSAVMMAEIHRKHMQAQESRAANARACRQEIEAARKAA